MLGEFLEVVGVHNFHNFRPQPHVLWVQFVLKSFTKLFLCGALNDDERHYLASIRFLVVENIFIGRIQRSHAVDFLNGQV